MLLGGCLEREINILKSELVPEHIILQEEEKQKLLEQYNITVKQLPKIFSSDPVVKTLKAKIGDVLKIIRKSVTAGTSVYYRVVVKL